MRDKKIRKFTCLNFHSRQTISDLSLKKGEKSVLHFAWKIILGSNCFLFIKGLKSLECTAYCIYYQASEHNGKYSMKETKVFLG